MDEEYDVIVLGTGLTVSAASLARDPASPPPPCGAAAPGRRPHLPVTAVLGAASSALESPKKTAPCPTPSPPPPPATWFFLHRRGPVSEKRPSI